MSISKIMWCLVVTCDLCHTDKEIKGTVTEYTLPRKWFEKRTDYGKTRRHVCPKCINQIIERKSEETQK